MHNNAVKVVLK